jgi:hypothetical protein
MVMRGAALLPDRRCSQVPCAECVVGCGMTRVFRRVVGCALVVPCPVGSSRSWSTLGLHSIVRTSTNKRTTI